MAGVSLRLTGPSWDPGVGTTADEVPPITLLDDGVVDTCVIIAPPFAQ